MGEPRGFARRVEQGVDLPPGTQERFSGFGLMGLPFTSGHILALRSFPASSLGMGYRSVWHRDPQGHWTFYQNVPPHMSCPRYFGSEIVRAVEVREIRIQWSGAHEFAVAFDGDHHLDWKVSLAATPATRLMNSLAGMVPDTLWGRPGILRLMGGLGGVMLGAGHMGLTGNAPNGQKFIAAPRQIWIIADSSAIVEGQDLGGIGPLQSQARLGDFWIPQRGIFAIGSSMFDAYDPARHLLKTSQGDRYD